MIRVETNSFQIMHDLIDFASTILTKDLPILFSEDGMYICAMDEAHVQMLSIFLPKDFFTEYTLEWESEEQAVRESAVVINSQDIKKIFSKIKGTKLSLSRDSSQDARYNNKLVIEGIGKKVQRFAVGLTDLGGNEHETNYDVILKNIQMIEGFSEQLVEYKAVKVSMSDLKGVVDAFTISSSETLNLTLGSKKSEFTVDTSVVSIEDSLEYLEIIQDKEEDQVGIFSVEFLNEFISKLKIKTESVNLYLQNDCPLSITPLFDDHKVSIKYYLAPRVEEDDENDDI